MRKSPLIGISRKDAPQAKTYSFQMRFTEVKAIEDGAKIRIKGFASTPDVDRYDDIVNPAAFANSMVKYMANPVVLLGHSPDKVLGQVVEYTLSPQGLEVTAELSNDIDNTFHNIMEKNLRGFSIGYRCLSANYKDEGNREIREIMELDLVEISVVSTPANASSLFTMAKSFKLAIAEMEQKSAEDEDKKEDTPPETPPEEEKKTETPPEEEKKTDEEKKSEEDTPNIESKTEDEKPETETPPPPKEEVPGDDKSTPVKAEETPEDKPKGMTKDEVKALIDEAVKAAIEPLATKNGELEGEIKSLKDSLLKKDDEQKEFAEKYTEHYREFKRLEDDFLSIEVRPGGVVSAPRRESKGYTSLTDAAVLKSIGL